MIRCKGADGPVLLVCDGVERGDVDSLDLSRLYKKVSAAAAFFLVLTVGVQEFPVDSLTLPDIEKIEEVCQGLRIVGAGAASDDDGAALPSFG